ncbi:MAG: sulfite exporter TauE/SafE family protein [Rhodobacterales bacterium]
MPDFSTLLPILLSLMAIGAFAGVLAGLLGVGGGIILVPAFYYTFTGLGYNSPQLVQICLATSLATIIFTSVRSVASHNKKGVVDWGILKTWAPGIAIGAIIGVFIAAELRSNTLLYIFGTLAFIIGLYMALGKASWRIDDTMPTGVKRAILSPLVGFLSVLMGIGGGSFGVPIMTLHGRPIHRAVATAAGFGLIIALPAAITFLFTSVPDQGRPPFTVGHVNIAAFLAVISMTMLTAPLGAKLAHGLDPKRLRRIFAVFLILVAINMLRKAYLG